MSRSLFSLPIACWLLLNSSPAVSDWFDWWQTPEQRADKALHNGDIDLLREQAPTDDWRGIGEFAAGEFAEAARMFNQAAAAHGREGDSEAQAEAIYNKGVSQVHDGQYQAAIDSFDTVLESNPSHEDARHNRDIAGQLLQLQQQQQPREQSGDSQGDSSGDQQQQAGEGQQQSAESGEPSSSTPGDSSEQQGEQPSGSSDQQDQDGSGGEPEQQQDQSDAQRALAAEAAGENQGDDSVEESGDSMQISETPMSEADQAAEQMLRRIPDDPAGLLRRKLEQSHRIEFPEVGNAREPW